MAKETTVAVIEPAVQEAQLSERVTEIERTAEAITISNDVDFKSAAEFGKLLKARSAEVKDFFKPMKDAANRAHKEIVSREKAMLKPLENAERVLKLTMGNYIEEQNRKHKEAEEAARKAAQKEAENLMREAIERESNGDSSGAEVALEEASIMEDMATTVQIAANSPKANGVSSRKDWEIVNIDLSKVPVEVLGMIIRPVDEAAVMRLIRQTKGQVEIPGITYKEKYTMSIRK